MADIDALLSLVKHCNLSGLFADAAAPLFELTVPAEQLAFGGASNNNLTAEAVRLDTYI